VRFAPSPTGFVHVGSLRTALYNYLFAKNHGGTFILRIEDTDQTRKTEGAVENLLSTLTWAGLPYDEGPEIGGNYGPYYQSQRLDIYKKYINELVDARHAYFCFCSEERLQKMREEQQAKKLTPKYDGKCRNISFHDAKRKASESSYVVRMKIPLNGGTIIRDIIRGEVTVINDNLDDQILLKSDGYPTYHLANVVDDHLMKITHIIRGEEWLLSTPKHIILYKYLGWNVPEFAHLPLLLNPDRSKLSKRQGDVAVEDYKARGYLPQALINFVALLGWNKGDDQEIFTMEELIDSFTLERVSKAGAIFNIEKLNWMNSLYLRDIEEEKYLHLALNEMKKCGLDSGNEHRNKLIALAVRKNLITLGDLSKNTAMFFNEEIDFYSDEALTWIKKKDSKAIFKALVMKR
jgi:glutamyl-tRNA synthetase